MDGGHAGRENRMALYIWHASEYNILIYRVSIHVLTSQSRYYIREVDYILVFSSRVDAILGCDYFLSATIPGFQRFSY